MLKKSLCLAAAALAGSLLSASAQNVYSLNVVGYVNRVLVPGYNLVANPLDDGKGNISTNLVPANLPAKSQIITFTPPSTYTTAGKLTSGAWSASTVIPPGTGYFVKVNTNFNFTNTYVGSLVGAYPGSVTNTINAGYSLRGSPYPIGGIHTNMGSNSMNFAALLPAKSQVITFTPPSTYSTAGKLTSGAWSAAFNIGVADGFFIKNNTNITYQWIQSVGP